MLAVRSIREHPEELESDLLEFFSVDLLDLWRGRLSLRRIAVLVKALGRRHGRSSLAAVMDESAEWDTSDYLLARISDALEMSNFLFLKANSSSDSQLTAPDPIPRPGFEIEDEEPEFEHSSGEEVAGFFAQMSKL
ncbi:hypothetical protein ACIQPR_43665 [Streptomyces sp. NPDC091280]|uniref:hypothetical protein n=1 Tax=Streptomyces sp. NPDC091280 TaxID=3365984 RepID=UPI0037FC6D3B